MALRVYRDLLIALSNQCIMKQVFSIWNFDLTSAAVMLLCMGFILCCSSKDKWSAALTALLLLGLCLISPLHVFARYYFSGHMTVHVILLLCVGPALIFSLRARSLERIFCFLKRHPLLGWSAGVGIMWFWHVPVIFNQAMAAIHNGNAFIAVSEYLSLIIGGMLFSAPLIHGDAQNRIEPLSGVAYLFTACFACSLLGLLITFAPAGTYHQQMAGGHLVQANELFNGWHMNKTADQEAAGLIMWVPCCLLYVSGALYLLKKYFNGKAQPATELN
ncbi:MAG: cytochrome c oxidase assembly protein [Flavisolibacter sp.]